MKRIRRLISLDFDLDERLGKLNTNVSGLIENLVVDYFIKLDNSSERGLLMNLKAEYAELEAKKNKINELAEKLEKISGKSVTRLKTEVFRQDAE